MDIKKQTKPTRYQIKTGSGRVHIMIEGVTYFVRGDKITNDPTSRWGKSICGSITSSAAKLTDEPSNCDKCKGL